MAITSIIGTIIPQYPNIDERYWATISAGKKALYESLGFSTCTTPGGFWLSD